MSDSRVKPGKFCAGTGVWAARTLLHHLQLLSLLTMRVYARNRPTVRNPGAVRRRFGPLPGGSYQGGALPDSRQLARAPGAARAPGRRRPPAAGWKTPVTGSANCAPELLWAGKFGKTQFTARQVSKRGGDLLCELNGDQVLLRGQAMTFLRRQIDVALRPTGFPGCSKQHRGRRR